MGNAQEHDPVRRFLAWCSSTSQRIIIHPSLEVRLNGPANSYGVFATQDIPAEEIIMRVPKTNLISKETSALSNILNNEEVDAHPMLGACLAYIYERASQEQSPWYPYIQLCPTSVPISKLWTKSQQRLLQGTEVAMVGGTTLSDFKDMYKHVVVPFMKGNAPLLKGMADLDFQSFCNAMSVIGSRAFEVDAYHGLALCPFADLLDHEVHENAHFVTDYDVCEVCGQLDNCQHNTDSDMEDDDSIPASASGSEDDEDASTFSAFSDEESHDLAPGDSNPLRHDSMDSEDHSDHEDTESEEDSLDMCDLITTDKIIPRGSQVYNTYGDCGNDVLLARYGFALLDNPHDQLSLAPELRSLLMSPQSLEHRIRIAKQIMASLEREKLVGSDDDDDSDDNDDDADEAEEKEEDDEDDDEMTDQDRAEDEEDDLPDACFLDNDGHPSPATVCCLYLLHHERDDVDATGPTEPDAALLDAVRQFTRTWAYVQPGRMPLPPLDGAHQPLRAMTAVLAALETLLERRWARYTTAPAGWAVDMTASALRDVRAALAGRPDDHDEDGARERFALIVRYDELCLLRRAHRHLAHLRAAQTWLLERAS